MTAQASLACTVRRHRCEGSISGEIPDNSGILFKWIAKTRRNLRKGYRFAQPIMNVCMTHSTSQPNFLQTSAWMRRLRSR